jgi:hypothetical protein
MNQTILQFGLMIIMTAVNITNNNIIQRDYASMNEVEFINNGEEEEESSESDPYQVVDQFKEKGNFGKYMKFSHPKK